MRVKKWKINTKWQKKGRDNKQILNPNAGLIHNGIKIVKLEQQSSLHLAHFIVLMITYLSYTVGTLIMDPVYCKYVHV